MNHLSDKELVILIREGDEDAVLVLFARYKGYALTFAKQQYHKYYNSGITIDEFYSVALECINIAINGFNTNSEGFYNYWQTIFSTRVLDFITSYSFFGKNAHLGDVSLDSFVYGDEKITRHEVIGTDDDHYEMLVHDIIDILNNEKNDFSDDEKIAIIYSCIKGYNTDEIMEKTNWSSAKTYKIVSRSKKKLANVMKNVYL